MYDENILKKLNKADLIKIILGGNKSQTTSPQKSNVEKKVMKQLEDSSIPVDSNFKPQTTNIKIERGPTEIQHICDRCSNAFFEVSTRQYAKDERKLCNSCIGKY